tara:strand:- start:94 stop:414 length:321 start_codon:yes stop_codon:yes gene_type:complete
MKTYYFSETSPADAAGDAILLPQSSFLNMDVLSATSIIMQFKKLNGTHDNSNITITHAAGKTVDAMKALAEAMAGNTKSNVIDLVQAANTHPVTAAPIISAITIAE